MSNGSNWPADKLSALRLGRRLVTEVPASRPDRRAFVDITPSLSAPDAQAREEGWARSDSGRSFRLEHWEYKTDRIEGFDYDIGAELVQTASAANEADLDSMLNAWQLPPDRFVHPWASEDPK
ncbi:hypothetical protein [Streptomyces sp. NPDC046727]|uniref:hypothetical protein n=1 Tax=Streptomyces sp. NPDC046727 TaxID=3155373 RepID=UPI0033C4279F